MKKRETFWEIAAYLAMIIGSGLVLTPVAWLISTSLKDASQVFDPAVWIPKPPRFDNYTKALSVMPFAKYLINTCVITFSCMALTIISSSLAAFGFARMRFPGRNILFVILLSTLMLPAQVTMIPIFKI